MIDLKFAPIKGDPDRHTFVVLNHSLIGYYDYSWARLGGMQYRAGRLHESSRRLIEKAILRSYMNLEAKDDGWYR